MRLLRIKKTTTTHFQVVRSFNVKSLSQQRTEFRNVGLYNFCLLVCKCLTEKLK